jgi:FkbM family methyltransferase
MRQMKPSRIRKTLPFKVTHTALAQLARSRLVQRSLERLISYAQSHLGIGSGADVLFSGEGVVFEELRKLAGPTCIFDVGANQGQFLRLIDEGLKAPCQVHCFEPSNYSHGILRKFAGDRADVTVNHFGLGRSAGEFDLFCNEDGSGLASLSKRQLDHHGIDFGLRERVRIETLDAYCAERGIEGIDLLKLDVEGHELDVLNGGERMFSERRVRMVMFEFGGCNIDSRTFFRDFYHFFRAHGMSSTFRILPAGVLQPIEGYTEALEQFRTTNFLVLRD